MALTAAETRALALKTALGVTFTLPAVDLTDAEFLLPDLTAYDVVADKLEMRDLTTGLVDGPGSFDKLMSSHKAHLKEQHTKGLITGDQYTKAYIELTATAMQTALAFTLGKESTHWAAVVAQAQAKRAEIDAVKAVIELEISKAQLAAAQAQAQTLEAQYLLTMMQVAEVDAKYELVERQIEISDEQLEAVRAQTMDTRSDGTTPVAGSVGKQKELYDQQIDSYQKDASYKVGKMYLDSWLTQKTLDEFVEPPAELSNPYINAVLESIRDDLGIADPPPVIP